MDKDFDLAFKKTDLPPQYTPKIEIRLSSSRTKQTCEFSVQVPVFGFMEGKHLEECEKKFTAALTKLNLLEGEPVLESPPDPLP